MKRLQTAALILAMSLLFAGCQKPQNVQPSPTAAASLSHFESYVSQTAFSFPKSWQYQDDDTSDGLGAAFTFTGGTMVIQFLWMNEEQVKGNVFLQQIEMDDVQEQVYSAGPYAGKIITGVESGAHTIAFEGSRDWYGTSAKLYMRTVLQTADNDSYAKERSNLLAMLQSVTVSTDANPQAVDMALQTYDFKSDFELLVKAPPDWMLNPQGDAEHGYVTLSFDVASGDNTYRVELATVTQSEFNGVIQSLKDLAKYEDVFDYSFKQISGVYTMTCLQEGKINRASIQVQKTGGKIRYLWVSSTLRPALDAAYYQSVIVPLGQTIQWKK